MNIDRRKFIKLSVSGLAGLCGCSIGFLKGGNEYSMIENYPKVYKKGYDCEETMFLNVAKYFNKPEDLASMPTDFEGSLEIKNSCGLCKGGVMGIVLFCDGVRTEDKEKEGKCAKLIKEYTRWWKENFPLRCKDILADDKLECYDIGLKATEYLQSLFKKEKV